MRRRRYVTSNLRCPSNHSVGQIAALWLRARRAGRLTIDGRSWKSLIVLVRSFRDHGTETVAVFLRNVQRGFATGAPARLTRAVGPVMHARKEFPPTRRKVQRVLQWARPPCTSRKATAAW